MLDTPEAVDAWIAERRRRFPTEEKVQDKKRKLEEAVARGQLTPEDIGTGRRKKPRPDATSAEGGRGFRGKGHQRGRGRRREGFVRREEPRTEDVDGSINQPAGTKVECAREASPGSASSADDDEAPEVASSKVPTAPACIPKVDIALGKEVRMSHVQSQEYPRKIPQPKKPPRNPFASRSTLLRNVLRTCYSLIVTALMIPFLSCSCPKFVSRYPIFRRPYTFSSRMIFFGALNYDRAKQKSK